MSKRIQALAVCTGAMMAIGAPAASAAPGAPATHTCAVVLDVKFSPSGGQAYPSSLDSSRGTFSANATQWTCTSGSGHLYASGSYNTWWLGGGLTSTFSGAGTLTLGNLHARPRVQIEVGANAAAVTITTSDGRVTGVGTGLYASPCLRSPTFCTGSATIVGPIEFVVSS